MTEQAGDNQPESKETLVSHLIELRSRLLKSVAAVLIVFAGLIPFRGDLYQYVALPLLEQLPETGGIIATQVAAP